MTSLWTSINIERCPVLIAVVVNDNLYSTLRQDVMWGHREIFALKSTFLSRYINNYHIEYGIRIFTPWKIDITTTQEMFDWRTPCRWETNPRPSDYPDGRPTTLLETHMVYSVVEWPLNIYLQKCYWRIHTQH